MSVSVLGIVLLAGLLHATWNTLAHKLSSGKSSQALINFGYSIICFPLIFLVPFPVRSAWGYIVFSAIFHIVYTLALLKSYEKTSFSTAYPLSRGLGPLIVAIFLFLTPSQNIDIKELSGICILVTGIITIAFSKGLTKQMIKTSYSQILLVGVCIAAYTMIDGIGVQISGSREIISYIAWDFFIQGPIVLCMLLALPKLRVSFNLIAVRSSIITSLITAAISLIAYGLVIWAQSLSPGNISLIAALRESGIVMATFLGVLFLGEKFSIKKVIGSFICLIGIIMLATNGYLR